VERQVRVSDVTVKTVGVTIQALKIGPKQMTLSVFRQLPTRPVLEPSCGRVHQQGRPWGLVRYFWDGCGQEGKHLHVVWSDDDGGQLYRDCVKPVRLEWATRTEVVGAVLEVKKAGWRRVCGDRHFRYVIEEVYRHYLGRQKDYPHEESFRRSPDAIDLDPAHLTWHGDEGVAVTLDDWVKNWNDEYDKLTALDQLFIAV
jgi:hypothetical protein